MELETYRTSSISTGLEDDMSEAEDMKEESAEIGEASQQAVKTNEKQQMKLIALLVHNNRLAISGSRD